MTAFHEEEKEDSTLQKKLGLAFSCTVYTKIYSETCFVRVPWCSICKGFVNTVDVEKILIRLPKYNQVLIFSR